MAINFTEYLAQSSAAISDTATPVMQSSVEAAIQKICDSLVKDAPFLVCGNGGSAADAIHITAELVGRFLKERRALKCICLSSNPSILTAWPNDYEFETVYSRQIEAYGEADATILGISTSGNSENVLRAFDAANKLGMTTIAMTGRSGGKIAASADIVLRASSDSTPLIQQVHICMYHFICAQIEERIGNYQANDK